MGIYCRDIYSFINSFAPFDIAEDFDNCGLLVGSMNCITKKVLLTLDITNDVVKEAKESGVDLIISHHPVIFTPLRNIDINSPVYMLISSGINALCAHTNLDMANKYGVNTSLADALELRNVRPLNIKKKKHYKKVVVFVPEGDEDRVMNAMCNSGAGKLGNYSKCGFLTKGEGRFCPGEGSDPYIGKIGECEKVTEIKIEVICPDDKVTGVVESMIKAHPYEKPAYDIFNEDENISLDFSCGVIGDLKYTMNSMEFARFVKEKLYCNGLRYTNMCKDINKVALCSGAGGDFLDFAIENDCDAFVTGEIKHHMILRSNAYGLTLVDAGHFKTEDVVFRVLKDLLEKNFPSVEFIKTNKFTDHIKYI